ncbi:MAG: MFS transporter [Gammaproteobacteria bacterium]
MSIIVALRKGNQAVIAADTAQSDETMVMRAKYLVNNEKILRAGDSFVGLAGWSASQDIFESLAREQPELLKFESRASIFDSFRAMHEVMKEKYFIDTQEDKEQPVESSQVGALIVNPHGIFEIESYRSVSEYTRFWALGSGKRLAMGAMHALYDTTDDVGAIARAGVEAACEFDDGCSLPLTCHVVTLAL